MSKEGSSDKFEGSTTQSLFDLGKDIAEMKGLLIGFDKRLSNLERWRWLLTGAILALAATRFPALTNLLGLR